MSIFKTQFACCFISFHWGFFYTKLPIFSWIGYYFILKINSVEMYTSY